MIILTASEFLARAIPDELKINGVLKPGLKVFGSVIREEATGRIVKHLQEASILAANPAIFGLSVGVEGIDVVQNEIIRQGVGRLEAAVGTLTRLTQAGLVLDVVGIGATAASLVVLSHKIDAVKRAVTSVARQVSVLDARIEQLQLDAIEQDFVGMQALARAYDEGWRLSGSAAEHRWRDVAAESLACQARFERLAEKALASDARNYGATDPFLDALAFSNGLRVSALTACDEVTAAEGAADDGARSLERLTARIGIAELAHVAGATPGTESWLLAQAESTSRARLVVRKIRSREAAARTRATALPTLVKRGIRPRDWLAAAREETQMPILMLDAED